MRFRNVKRMVVTALALVIVGVGVFALAAAAGAGASRLPSKAFVVVLPVPSAGDVTYGVAEVRITGARPVLPSGAARGARIFAQRLDGLALAARSPSWKALGATTRVYVVAASVPHVRGARLIAFFIVRRIGTRHRDAARGQLTFTVANARADTSAFWVRGVDAHGFAEIFAVRDILTTALDNWSRYVAALKVEHELAAAVSRPRASAVTTPPVSSARSRRARVRTLPRVLFTGGEKPDTLVTEMFHLIFGTIGDGAGYAAAKKNPLVVRFIADELHNPTLAKRWQALTGAVPSNVPDRYAAAAQEEKLFAPRLPAAHAAHAAQASCPAGDYGVEPDCYPYDSNSSSLAGGFFPEQLIPSVTVTVVKAGDGQGTVTDTSGIAAPGHPIDCGSVCVESDLPVGLGIAYTTLKAAPAAGSTFAGWQTSSSLAECLPVVDDPDGCQLFTGLEDTTVTAAFNSTAPGAPLPLTVAKTGTGSGTVTSTPSGIDCGSTCTVNFATGQHVTLTATAAAGSAFGGWSGCDLAQGTACELTMTSPRSVIASFTAPPSVGSISEFNVPTSAAQPFGIASGPDGNLWFTEEEAGKIGRLVPGEVSAGTSDGITEYSLPVDPPVEPTSIAVDGKGNLWFAGASNSAIGEITTGGQISEYPLPGSPAASEAPNSIALGPDGNMWFTINAANEIGRIDPSQAVAGTSDGISEFPTPTGASNPEGITAGPDGNLWFTETYTNKIGRLVPGGVSAGTSDGITEYPIPSPGDGPAQIAAGPDGNLWFTDVYSGDLGRIVPGEVSAGTPDGITYYDPPTAGSGPVGIAAGADGNLWFAEQHAENVGRLVPGEVLAGTSEGITEYPVPTTNAEPESLVAGPDGNIWFTELDGDKIGTVDTGAP